LARKVKEFWSFLEAVVRKSKSENYIFEIILEIWNEKFFREQILKMKLLRTIFDFYFLTCYVFWFAFSICGN